MNSIEKGKYNVLIINGSPHERGTTFTALKSAADALNENGVDTDIVHVGKERVAGCIACLGCRKAGKCIFDDIVNVLAEKLREADGLIIGSPVYYASPNGTLTSILDRLFYSSGFDKTMKLGASVVAARRGGCTATFDALNKYFTISGMPIVSSTYWNQIHGKGAEEAESDLEGVQTMRTLGRNMAFLIKAIRLAKEQLTLPEKEQKIFTNFIR